MTSFSNRSFWIDDYGHYDANPPLTEDLSVDVAVIGGGFQGLSSAWHLRRDDQSTSVALLEAEVVGYGASGRSGGWVMTQFGLDQLMVKSIYGKQRALEAYEYCSRAVDYTQELIRDHQMDSDYSHPGVMRVALDDEWVGTLEYLKKLYEDFGVGEEMTWLEGAALAEEYQNPNFKAAIYEPNMGLLNPCKHVREWKRLACEAGALVFENTPAISIDWNGSRIVIKTPRGTVRAERLVLATNAYTHLLTGGVVNPLKRDQAPLFARAIVTERLSEQQWKSVGWGRRNAIESTLGLFHWFRPTADGRIIFYNAYYMDFARGNEMNLDYDPVGIDVSVRHFKQIFPTLKDVKIAQAWGGPISATADMVPHLGFLDKGERVVYSTGCWGHGVATSHLHGRTTADLLSGKRSELTDTWFVNRKPFKWPPKPFDNIGRKTFVEYYRWMDRRAAKNTMFEYD